MTTIPAERVELIFDARAELGECPLWSPEERCLWWIDIRARRLHRFDPATRTDVHWTLPREPGCIGLAASGGLVAALRDGFYHLDPARERVDCIAPIDDPYYDARRMRFNDGRCDPAGRFWAGAMDESRQAPCAAMYCIERGVVRRAFGGNDACGVMVSNGLAFSPDGLTLYQSDTPAHVVYAYPFDVRQGQAGSRRIFASVPANQGDRDYGGRPDGAAIDAEGAYWSAQYEGGRVLRFAPDGRMLAQILIPVRRPTMVAFGGPDLRHLFITSAREGANSDELERHPMSGGLFCIELDVQGRVEPQYVE